MLLPQVMTDPSDLSAAKAPSDATTFITGVLPSRSVLTLLVSPPKLLIPQAITEPSDLNAANE